MRENSTASRCEGTLCSDTALCSADETLQEAGMTTVFDRYESQQPQCRQGLQGSCCVLCSNGPCKITAKSPFGVCGASPDLIVARNLLQKAAIGAAGNTYHAENVARTLLAAAREETGFSIRDVERLNAVASSLGISTDQPANTIAEEVASLIINEINMPDNETMTLTEAFAPAKRIDVWKELGIMPGGVNSEIRTALVKCMTSVNNDPVDMLLTAMKLSIANSYAGLSVINMLQDILMGASSIGAGTVNLGILDEDSVNIVCHGHQPLLASLVARMAGQDEFAAKARQAGAAGIKVYGSMCEGQEMVQRPDSAFAGQLGNWLHQEFALGTGAIDLVMMDYNCSIPSLPEYAARFNTRLVTTDQAVRMTGVERLEHTPETAGETARQILERAIGAFGERGEVSIPEESMTTMAGFSTESVLGALGGDIQPLIDAIASGKIRGIAAVVGCTTASPETRGCNIIKLTEKLVANDILVVSGGCTSSTLQNAGFTGPESAVLAGDGLKAVCDALGVPPVLSFGSCTDIGRIADVTAAVAAKLDVDIPQLPVVVSAPEWLEQKAVADAFFSVSYGLLTHLSPVPPVTGSELITGILTSDVEGLTGGRVLVEEDPEAAADALIEHIEKKRSELGLTS